MRILPKIMLMSLVFFAARCPGDKSDCAPELQEAYVSSVGIIVAAVIEGRSANPDEFIAKPTRVFKGSVNREVVIDVSDAGLALEVGQEYLFYGNAAPSNNLHIDQCSRSGPMKEKESDLRLLSEIIPCINPSADKNVACIQIYEPVCGCDNKTYGNSCVARSEGINIYTIGECKD